MLFLISNSKNTFSLFYRIWNHLRNKRKIQIFGLFLISVFSAFSEILSLTAIIPFLALITSSKSDINLPELPGNFLNFENITELSFAQITILFVFTVIFASIIRLLNLWLNGKMAAAIGSDISYICFKKSISQPYLLHINRNSSNLIATLITEINLTVVAINLFLKFLTALILVIGILLGLSIINLKLSISAIFIFSFIYLLLGFLSRKKLLLNSQFISSSTKKLVKITQEGFGAIREVILNSQQTLYTDIFIKTDRPMRLKQANSIFLASFPKNFIEAFGLVFIAFFAFYLTNQNDENIVIIPILGSFALGSQKLLPALQQCYGAWAGMKSYNKPLQNVLELLNQENLKIKHNFKKLKFHGQILVKDVSFYYPGSDYLALNSINLRINSGQAIGIIGETGSGKSTLVDLIMGLIKPKTGHVLVDGKDIYDPKENFTVQSWTSNISHVPQTIFLSDSSIGENIAFGIPKKLIDLNLLIKVSKISELYEFIKSKKEGFNTIVGEKGVKLSGGQRQRIAIARALYKKAKVIIFDEATSALDSITEKKIIVNIFKNNKNITLIMISHRIPSLINCDRIIKIDKGEIIENTKASDFFK